MENTVTGTTARRRLASDELADRLRRVIEQRGLRAGDRVGREEDLAREFGVSRPTLREALRSLSSAHLIRAVKGPGGGIFVESTLEQGMARNLTGTIASMLASGNITVEELLETRLLLEVPLAGLAARRATDDDVTHLRDLLTRLAAAQDNPVAFGDADTEIHRAIGRIAGNRLASALTAWIADLLLPTVRARLAPAMVEAFIVEQLRTLVDAVENADAERASRAMHEHLVYTVDLVSALGPAPQRPAPSPTDVGAEVRT